MRLSRVRIENFRGIDQLCVDFDDTTVLIGENNSGKTAVLDALRVCLRELGPRRRVVFETYDFHLKDADAEPSTASPIRIELTFADETDAPWDDQLVGKLQRYNILQVDSGRHFVVLCVTCRWDPVSREIGQEWSFLNLDGQPLTGVPDAALGALQNEVPYFYLGALRDAARQFDANGPFWRPFLRNSELAADKKAEIEQRLREVNELVVASHTSFEQVCERLQDVQEVVPMATGHAVSIEAVPGRMFDMLAKAQVNLSTMTGAKLPVGRHGEGMQSLAVLMLFSAFLESWPNGTAIVALEEPEAHLHPAAVRSLWSILDGISGQTVISTHSGDLLSEVDVRRLRRLARTSAGSAAYRVPTDLLSDEETRKLNYHVRRARGELLFARCWLLVEGETEAWIYPAAARAIGADLHREGIRVVEYSQSDVGLLAKVANALGIPWYCVVDDDAGRAKYEGAVMGNLGGAPAADRVVYPYTNAEVHLLSNGYDGVYAPLMPPQKLARLTTPVDGPGYWADYAASLPGKAKTRGAAAVAAEMESRGEAGVTGELRAILHKVVALAGGTR